MDSHHTNELSNATVQMKEGENEASSAETSLSVEDSAQHGRPAEAEAASEHMAFPAEELQNVLAEKIARMEGKKNEDKDDEKYFAKIHKKSAKDLKEQLANVGPEEKIRILHEKYCEKANDLNKLERANERLQRQYDNLQREVDASSQELNRTKNVKTKLEALCKQVSPLLEIPLSGSN
jgi:chromosome segregation ATPase